MSRQSVLSLDAKTYSRHPLHQHERTWVETNCYADLWIEVLHALKLEPLASLAYTVAVDFEGDQWTFFKPSLGELQSLYGIDVQELNIWRPLCEHAALQASRGRLVMAEVDAFYLPDTQGTDYRQGHSKTTIAIETIDVATRELRYFHNAGYYSLGPEDFGPLFGLDVPAPEVYLPPYVEFAKVTDLKRLEGPALAALSTQHLRAHLARAPKANPVKAFAAVFVDHLDKLKKGDWPNYHLYAFATVRQLGAAFELAGQYLRWMEANGQTGAAAAATPFEEISTFAKTMILKGARAVTTGKPVDFAPMLESMAKSWDDGMKVLRERYGT
jgi:hypothetical protein